MERPLSLTGHLAAKRSPIHDWFEDNLPHTRAIVADANDKLCGVPRATACPVPTLARTDPALVGTAIDYVLRITLRQDALDDTVAHKGARLLDGHPGMSGRPSNFAALASSCACELQPWRRRLTAEEVRQLCLMCAVLARFEQYFRAGGRVAQYVVPPLRRVCDGDDLHGLASALVPEPTLADLEALAAAAIVDHADLRSAQPLHLNPNFSLSVAIGGADADVIAGGSLLEFKATAKTSPVQRPEVWQLIGYALLDTDDTYAIASVGVSALRWRKRIVWPVSDLFDEAAKASKSLAEWRAEFAELLAPLATTEAARAREIIVARAHAADAP
jgi:hypothetical protein